MMLVTMKNLDSLKSYSTTCWYGFWAAMRPRHQTYLHYVGKSHGNNP